MLLVDDVAALASFCQPTFACFKILAAGAARSKVRSGFGR